MTTPERMAELQKQEEQTALDSIDQEFLNYLDFSKLVDVIKKAIFSSVSITGFGISCIITYNETSRLYLEENKNKVIKLELVGLVEITPGSFVYLATMDSEHAATICIPCSLIGLGLTQASEVISHVNARIRSHKTEGQHYYYKNHYFCASDAGKILAAISDNGLRDKVLATVFDKKIKEEKEKLLSSVKPVVHGLGDNNNVSYLK